MAQTTDTVLMIRPAAFSSNPETASSNPFQDPRAMPAGEAAAAALAEFEVVVAVLVNAGVRVCVMDDTPEPRRPDAIFPNNWISTHDDGTVVLYPMQAQSRRREVRHDVVEKLRGEFGFDVRRVLDLTGWVARDRFLEGTGSMVLDRENRVAFACRSTRTDDEVLGAFCAAMDFEPVAFDATDAQGVPVYHTNVLMWIGDRVAAACVEAIADERQRAHVQACLTRGGRELITLSHAQMAAFAGNMLELKSAQGPVIAVSAAAVASLSEQVLEQLRTHAHLVVADIPSIETCSGGSVRCMLAEIFLPSA